MWTGGQIRINEPKEVAQQTPYLLGSFTLTRSDRREQRRSSASF